MNVPWGALVNARKRGPPPVPFDGGVMEPTSHPLEGLAAFSVNGKWP
jgi:hypothetical protein